MKKANSPNTQLQDTYALGLKFWLWLAATLSVVFIITAISTAWAVQYVLSFGAPRFSDDQTRFVIAVADFPGLVRTAITEVRTLVGGDPLPLLLDRKSIEKPQWVRHFPAKEDSGYLLFSGVDPVEKRSIVKLIRISDGSTMAHWNPDWHIISKQSTSKKFAPEISPSSLKAIHPLLLADGDIIFNTLTSLVRQSPCNTEPVWILNEAMHHSNELDGDGTIWVPSVSQDGYAENPWLQERLRDDAITHVTTEGRILEKRSFARILRDNGLEGMLLGFFGPNLNSDPIHLNQIQVAHQNSRYWQQGDLLISARHLSTIFLYRPSTGRIIWHKTGPWKNQHSVDFVDDHRISVFDNNVVSSAPNNHAFMTPGDNNHVVLYDFDTEQTSQPFAALLAEARPITITGGRARVLPDGGLFIEEENYGRHLRFSKDRLLWSRVNDYDSQRIGFVSWSRYLTSEEARIPLQALVSRHCSAAK